MRRLFVLLALSLALAGPARAETIERVVAKVNGQIITLSEFQNRQVAAAQSARVDPAGIGQFLRQNNARLLQEAIDEILILQKAEDAGIHAPSAWIDEAIDGIKKDNKITTDEQMQEALAREGLTLAELRANIERGVVRRIVMQRDVQPKIEASEADVKAEYEKLKATEFTKAATVSLQEILIPEDKGGLELAREVLAKARGGEDFQALARTYSSAGSRANGGDLGQLSQGEMAPALEKEAFGLAVGSISEPLPVEGGYRLLKVTAKTTGSTTPYDAVKDRVRDRVMMSRFDKAYDEFVEELRKNSVVVLLVREVPLQLTGPIPEGSLREALEPLGPSLDSPSPPAGAAGAPTAGAGAPTAAPASAAPANTAPPSAAPAAPSAGAPAAPAAPAASGDDEFSTSGQAAPEKVAPPPPPQTTPPPPQKPPPTR
jgi:peptidyl-prolyl cis-trans isomerase SurA